MGQDEAIKRTSLFLQKIFHDDEEALSLIRVAEKNKDIDFFTSALDQIEKVCDVLKQGLWNK